ncbi:MAG TPA: ubiquitin-like domain-containing protein [Bacillus sp. (in: firmicutes)]|nr:G5 and 3D domain-containing protein [Bacillus litorisediminis]HWO76062.1 ubiquitin-like domain-containing protein [Bacillus sp. (in: firmicutes)]
MQSNSLYNHFREKEAFFNVNNPVKNLFSEMSKRRLLLLSFGALVFLLALTLMVYQGTKKTVALTLDGEERIVKTHADTVEDILRELEIQVGTEDYLFPKAETKIKNNLEIAWEPAKQVTITYNDKEPNKVWTTADSVKELLEQQGIEVKEQDQISPGLNSSIKNGLQINVEEAFKVTLVDGGKLKELWSTSTTVADFLKQHGIQLNELDRVEPKLEQTIDDKTKINVVRVEKVTDVVEESVDYAVVTKNDNSLKKGTEKVIQEGREGQVSKVYQVVLENGKEVSRKLVETKTLQESQNKIVAVGTQVQTASISRGSAPVSGKEFYVNSTAYTAFCNGCSGVTATGINLRSNPDIKVIAVDPSVIPLGSKVYVEGYGHAIAADTGSAIKGNKIDVFFATKEEAYRWGVRKVKITILE